MTGRGGPLVLAVGGHALAGGAALGALCRAIDGRPAVVTHGNGPEVGRLAAATAAVGGADPLDVLDAATQGEIGYRIVTGLTEGLPDRSIVAVLTRVEIDAADEAVAHPTKPVGPVLDPDGAAAASGRGWTVATTSRGVRRVVPSPRPVAVAEVSAIASLLRDGFVVVAAGGGGIPMVHEGDRWTGVEAVVDKDLTSGLLAQVLDAEHLVLLTDVDAVRADADPDAPSLGRVPAAGLDPDRFEPGTMGPKVEAAVRFVRTTGRWASIGALEAADEVAVGRSGTVVVP